MKEKIIDYIEDLESKANDSDRFFTERNNALIEIEKLKKENNELRKLYQRTYKHLFEIGNDELAYYFQAQIDECPTFYIEPIIDYYEETKRLEAIRKDALEYINNNLLKLLEEIEYCNDKDILDQFAGTIDKILNRTERDEK